MIQIKYLISLVFVLFIAEAGAQTGDSEKYGGMTWYLKRSVALDAARSEGKQVFMVWGRTTCSITTDVRRKLVKEPLRSIISEHYILWFSDYEKYNRYSTEVSDYLSVFSGYIAFPAICIIDTFDVKVAYGLRTGAQEVNDLQAMLNQYVGNDHFENKEKASVNVYVSGKNLVIKNDIYDEIVSVFTMSGSLVDRFRKVEYGINRNISAYAKGILVVTGSSGWSKKIVVE
ncbi:MAG: hypothetical protein LBV74_19945 [Tannerella sp.]|jgi:hypothetical protein|nr:hypothetical protein [Tannerella sp.]